MARKLRVSIPALLVVALLYCTPVLSEGYQQFCRCQCYSFYEIAKVDECSECSREYCSTKMGFLLDRAKEKAELEGKSSSQNFDLQANCFQRESIKDRVILGGFALTTVILLAVAIVKPYIR